MTVSTLAFLSFRSESTSSIETPDAREVYYPGTEEVGPNEMA